MKSHFVRVGLSQEMKRHFYNPVVVIFNHFVVAFALLCKHTKLIAKQINSYASPVMSVMRQPLECQLQKHN